MNESGYREITSKSLRTAGMRVTNQRSLIMEIVRQGGGHLDADEIYRRAREKRSRLSFSTVYRALQTFKKLGLVDELHFDEGHHHYEVKTPGGHHHLVCLGCGKVVEFHQHLSRYIKRNVPEAKDFDITETEVRVSGFAPGVRQEGSDFSPCLLQTIRRFNRSMTQLSHRARLRQSETASLLEGR